jgi:hypothetical protein
MATTTNNQPTGWVGWVYFAAFMLLFNGVFQMIAGLTALLNDKYYAVKENTLVVFDITTWGWIHLAIGLFVICTGMALFNGSTWARVVAIIAASLIFIAQFAFIGVYPIWSIVAMVLSLLVFYALLVHGNEARLDA